MNPISEVDVLILGAGAAGLICAIEAGRRGRRVLVLDHAEGPGKKILISGGGRCNFTNRNAAPENYLCANPHFVKSALARYTPQDFIALVEKHDVAYHEKTLGQLFCDRSAQQILNLLLRECAEATVRIQTATRILAVAQADSRFRVETSAGTFSAASLVVATGGLSIPKMGATALGYELAAQFGHRIVETRPGLVPLVFNPQDQADWCDLPGLAAEVVVSAEGSPSRTVRNTSRSVRSTFREKMLITHRGLSGPAILQISSYWRPGESIELDLAPEPALDAARNFATTRGRNSASEQAEALRVFAPLLRPQARRDLAAADQALRAVLPSRLANRWLALHAPEAHAAQSNALPNTALAEMERELHAWRITPAGTEGYAKAEVTVGGVDTDQLDAKTMQSRTVPGLYFIGEVVDVTGHLGGYNFQWAWSSGVSAGQSA
ncbi:MAG: NAD(P)/FAD-dependent oxidoreductase [Acidobacteriaceae bacterium]|nr:NAD(P)/FAD-dependent oxidoreductase [Acidobacteriaceae bacterium]